MKTFKHVAEYISAAPIEVPQRLRAVRAAIQASAPGADERISYGMPFYSYKGEAGIQGRLCYFGFLNADIRFYMRPRDLEPHLELIARHMTTKSALRFPADEPIPISVIEKLVRDAVCRHEAAGLGSIAKEESRRKK
jgi:uncharacterized protein YdhG (YjbR/CyaY superfamily)